MKKFIKTTDEDTAKKLREQGFTEINEGAAKGVYCFVNDAKLIFEDEKKLTYTNTLTF